MPGLGVQYRTDLLRHHSAPATEDDESLMVEVLLLHHKLPGVGETVEVMGAQVTGSISPLNHPMITVTTADGRVVAHVAFNETDGYTYINWC